MARTLVIVASALLLATVLERGLARADGAWLDGPVTNWNQLGMAIPPAPPRHTASQPRCFDPLVVPDSPARQALVDAGWFLFNAPRATGSSIEILNGQANADGMCRPTDYQVFVFVDEVFAGTLSPGLMHSRTDGALAETGLQPGDVILASYLRYTRQDPLCCPSARSTATFKVDRSGPLPVVELQSVSTEPTGAVSAPPPSPAPAPTLAPGSPSGSSPVQLPRSR
jgi:LppP/LprE lipoprotein